MEKSKDAHMIVQLADKSIAFYGFFVLWGPVIFISRRIKFHLPACLYFKFNLHHPLFVFKFNIAWESLGLNIESLIPGIKLWAAKFNVMEPQIYCTSEVQYI